jgi:hypothetical protein
VNKIEVQVDPNYPNPSINHIAAVMAECRYDLLKQMRRRCLVPPPGENAAATPS